MSILTKKVDTDVPKNVRLYGTELTGNTVIPLALDQSGQISVSLETADTLIAKVSGETLITKNSGQTITVASGVVVASGLYVVTAAAVTLESGSVVMPEAFSITSGMVSIQSGQIIAKNSGQIISIASGAEIIWRTPIISGSIIVSGTVSVSGNIVTAKISGETVVVASGAYLTARVSGETVVVASGTSITWRPANLSGLVTKSYIQSPIDVVDGALITITNKDYRIHNGNFFEAGQYTVSPSVVSGVVLHMVTPASLSVHTVYTVESDVAGLVELYENPTISTSGTVILVLNRKRDSLTSSTTLVFSQPGYTSGAGLLLARRYIGVNSKDSNPGGQMQGLAEWIFKSGEDYLLKFVPESTPSHINLRFDWSEV